MSTNYIKYAIAALALASSASYAVEPAEGWYAGLLLGFSDAPSLTFNVNNPFAAVPLPAKLTYDIYGNAAAQIGFRCNKLRYEGEVVFNRNPYDRLTVGNFSIKNTRNNNGSGLGMKGNTSMIAGLFNAYYEFYDEDYSATKWVPYAGLGIGYASIHNRLDFYVNSVLLNENRNSVTKSSAIAQGILGINYFFTDNVSLGSDLRYMTTKKISIYDSRVTAATWNLVMNVSFDQPAY